MPTRWDEDARLLDAWRAGDKAAGEALFDRHIDSVTFFFENKVHVAPEDLAQATFLRILESKERISDGRKFRAWVLGIARNVLHKHLRTLARERDVDPDVDCMASLEPGAATLAGERREQRLLLEGLRALSINDQMVLELVYWERLKSLELAEFLGISHSAARTRVVVARDRLTKEIAKLERSTPVLDSTIRGLDGWAADLRAQIERLSRRKKN